MTRATVLPLPTQDSGYVTPLVRRLAARTGIDLSTVRGTGAAGRITAADVRRKAGMAAPRAAAAAQRPTLTIQTRSFWTRDNTTVSVDAYSLNPLLDDLRQTDPARLARARQRVGPPPTLMATGDLPMVTASGTDPQLLAQLPWVARHAAASASSRDVVAMLEAYSPPSQATWDYALQEHCLDQGVLLYEQRMRAWAGAADA